MGIGYRGAETPGFEISQNRRGRSANQDLPGGDHLARLPLRIPVENPWHAAKKVARPDRDDCKNEQIRARMQTGPVRTPPEEPSLRARTRETYCRSREE